MGEKNGMNFHKMIFHKIIRQLYYTEFDLVTLTPSVSLLLSEAHQELKRNA